MVRSNGGSQTVANLYRPLVTIPICSMGLEMFVGKYSSPMGHFGYVPIATFVRGKRETDENQELEGQSNPQKALGRDGFYPPFFLGGKL